MTTLHIGAYFIAKARARAAEAGVRAAALGLRKQGVCLEVALALLVGRRG